MSSNAGNHGTPSKRKGAKRSEYELAEMHQRRALLLRSKGQNNDIVTCMMTHPQVIPEIRQFLVTKELLPALGVTKETPVEKVVKPEPPDETSAQGQDMNETCFPDTYTRIGGDLHGLSAKWLKYLLRNIEPISLGPFAVRGLIPSGRREIDVQEACRVIEFTTGMDESTGLSGELRFVRHFLDQAQAYNERNNRPARDLRLPPQWTESGWYRIQNITHRGVA